MDILALAALAEPSPCRTAQHNSFCTEVTYDTSLPGGVGPAELDAAARADYEVALPQPGRPGKLLSAPACLDVEVDAVREQVCALRAEPGGRARRAAQGVPLPACSLRARATPRRRCSTAAATRCCTATRRAPTTRRSSRRRAGCTRCSARRPRSCRAKPLGVAAGLPLAFALVVAAARAVLRRAVRVHRRWRQEGAHDVAKMEAREALRDISADGGGGGALVS